MDARECAAGDGSLRAWRPSAAAGGRVADSVDGLVGVRICCWYCCWPWPYCGTWSLESGGGAPAEGCRLGRAWTPYKRDWERRYEMRESTLGKNREKRPYALVGLLPLLLAARVH